MPSGLSLSIFLAYNVSLFFISELWLLGLIAGLNLCLVTICARRRYHALLRLLLGSLGLVLFVGIWNLLALGWEPALRFALRLFDALLATILYSYVCGMYGFAQGLAWVLTPLKWLKVDTRTLILSVTLALNLIPLMMREARSVESALRLKGLRFNLWNLLVHPQIFVTTYFRAVLARAAAMEQGLELKGYE